jgi:hypothetical protein
MNLYTILDFGAVGDGVTNNGASINKAIQTCAANGGGQVIIPSGGTYLSSSIELLPYVDLHIQKGAVLLASSDIDDYIRPSMILNTPETALNGNPVVGKPAFAFIYAKNADHLCISGEGIIDGNGFSFVKRTNRYHMNGDFYPRPTTIYVEHSHHITFKDFTVRNVPFWTLHPAGCNDVLISHIRILNELDVANSDGIDPDHCQNVRIIGCHIQCADDCICLKTSKGNEEYGPCENILISDCTLISTSSAIKIGTEGVGDFRNVTVTNCIISKSNRGLSIQIRDGGNVENVSFSHITIETRRFSEEWWGAAEPIYITTLSRQKHIPSGKISHIRFFDIYIKSENGIFIYSNDPSQIQEVSFEKVTLTLSKRSKWPVGISDLRPGEDGGILFENPTSGIYAKNVTNLSFSHTKVFWGEEKDASFANAFVGTNILGLTLHDFVGKSAFAGIEDILLANTTFSS